MGEAKRRKLLDPNYGKQYMPEIKISKSTISNNWLVMIDESTFDSSIKLEDAQLVADWLRKELKVHPLRRNFTTEQLMQWISKYGHQAPDTEAEVMVTNNDVITKTRFFG